MGRARLKVMCAALACLLVGGFGCALAGAFPQSAHAYSYLKTDTGAVLNRCWLFADPGGYFEWIMSDPHGPRPNMFSGQALDGWTWNGYVRGASVALWSDQNGQDDLSWYPAWYNEGCWERGGARFGHKTRAEHGENGTGWGCVATYGYGYGSFVLDAHDGLDALMHAHSYLNDTEGGNNFYGGADFWPRVQIRYEANGGAGAPGPHYKYIGNLGFVSSSVPVRIGYTFEGWSTLRSGPVNIAPSQRIGYEDWNLSAYMNAAHSGTSSGPKDFWPDPAAGQPSPSGSKVITLYAQWKPVSYEVSYQGNGATAGSTESSLHTYDAPKPLTANGFSRSYILSCDSAGGSAGMLRGSCDWAFKSWNAAADGGSGAYADKAMVKNLRATPGSTSLYAQWGPGTLRLPHPGEKPNSRFKGWYTEASGGRYVGLAGSLVSIDADTTYYAQWDRLADVSYYVDGESVPAFSERRAAGEPYTTSAQATETATKVDCEGFDGWYADPACTRRYSEGSAVPDEGLALYGRNRVLLSYGLSDRSREFLEGRALFEDESLTLPLEGGVALPRPVSCYYGDRVSFERGPSAFFEARGRARELVCEPGAYPTPQAEGTPARSARITRNTVVYLHYLPPVYDGIELS